MSTNNKPRVRYDAEGRRDCKGNCQCTLKKPRTINIDADGQRLRKVAEEIFVHKTRKDLSDDDRADMKSIIHLIDGEIPTPSHDHPAFWAGIFLGALRRHESRVAMDAARKDADDKIAKARREAIDRAVALAEAHTSHWTGKGKPAGATVGPRKNAEAEAKEKMKQESANAWRAKKKK